MFVRQTQKAVYLSNFIPSNTGCFPCLSGFAPSNIGCLIICTCFLSPDWNFAQNQYKLVRRLNAGFSSSPKSFLSCFSVDLLRFKVGLLRLFHHRLALIWKNLIDSSLTFLRVVLPGLLFEVVCWQKPLMHRPTGSSKLSLWVTWCQPFWSFLSFPIAGRLFQLLISFRFKCQPRTTTWISVWQWSSRGFRS